MRTPLTVITGPLGGGKTTLLRHLLEATRERLAILMNEFGELAIDSRVIEGRHVRLAELDGGCVCCSLLGEFEAAVAEILDTARPERLVLETTGVAEPDALLYAVGEDLPRVRLDGVVAVADADALERFPALGHTTRLQFEAADLILLNKIDLVAPAALDRLRARLAQLNPRSPVLPVGRCRVDPALLFGIGAGRARPPARHVHQPEYRSWSYVMDGALERACFEALLDGLSEAVYRAKGLLRLDDGEYLFNYVAGRWDFEPFPAPRTELAFIGAGLDPAATARLRAGLDACRGR